MTERLLSGAPPRRRPGGCGRTPATTGRSRWRDRRRAAGSAGPARRVRIRPPCARRAAGGEQQQGQQGGVGAVHHAGEASPAPTAALPTTRSTRARAITTDPRPRRSLVAPVGCLGGREPLRPDKRAPDRYRAFVRASGPERPAGIDRTVRKQQITLCFHFIFLLRIMEQNVF